MGAQPCCRAASDPDEDGDISATKVIVDEHRSAPQSHYLEVQSEAMSAGIMRQCSPGLSPGITMHAEVYQEPNSPGFAKYAVASEDNFMKRQRTPSIINEFGQEHEERPEEQVGRRKSLTRQPTGHIRCAPRYLTKGQIESHINACEVEGIPISPQYVLVHDPWQLSSPRISVGEEQDKERPEKQPARRESRRRKSPLGAPKDHVEYTQHMTKNQIGVHTGASEVQGIPLSPKYLVSNDTWRWQPMGLASPRFTTRNRSF